MAILIRQGRIEPDDWSLLEDVGAERLLAGTLIQPDANLLVPASLWPALRCALGSRDGRLGIALQPTDDPAPLGPDIERFSLVTIAFPRFLDGRGYSLARILRARYGYRRELRAVGDVLRDQLPYLARCGFDAFALRDDQDQVAALAAFADFSVAYQPPASAHDLALPTPATV